MTSARTRRCSATLSIAIAVALAGLSARAPAAEFTNTVCGYRVTYPDGWNAHMHADGRNLVLRNFPAEKTPPGGFFPPGGVCITIQMFPPYTNPGFRQGDQDDSVLTRMARNQTVIAQTSAASGKPASVVSVSDLFPVRLVNTIVHKGEKVFFIDLMCGTGDPNCPGYEHVLDDVIASLTIIGSTPVPGSPTP